MKKSLLILLLSLFTTAFSQIRFEKGYYINNNNEKSEVLIKNEDWNLNPIEFIYKTSENGNSMIGKIKDVKEFGVYNFSKYVRFTGQIDESTDNLQYLTDKSAPIWIDKTVFLKQIFVGDKNLYIYNDEQLLKFFYSDVNTPITQLIYKRYFPANDNGSYATNDEYKNQLKKYFTSNDASKKIDKLSYKEQILTTFFEDYNPLQTATSEQRSLGAKSIFNLYLRPGISFSNVDYEVPANPGISLAFDNKISPRFGVELEYVLPFRKNKFALFVEPTFTTYKQTGRNSVISNSEVQFSAIEIPVGARYYMFINKDSKIFIDGLFNLTTIKVGDNFLEYELVGLTVKKEFNVNARPNAGFGLGFNYKDKWVFQARSYLKKYILNDYLFINGYYNNFSLIVGYNIL